MIIAGLWLLRCPQGRERYSIACFYEPNFDALVEVLPQVCAHSLCSLRNVNACLAIVSCSRGGHVIAGGRRRLWPHNCACTDTCHMLWHPLQCVPAGEAPRYPPTTAGQHILDKYATTHAGYSGPLHAGGAKH